MIWWFLPCSTSRLHLGWWIIRRRFGLRSRCERRIWLHIWIRHRLSRRRLFIRRRFNWLNLLRFLRCRLPKGRGIISRRLSWIGSGWWLLGGGQTSFRSWIRWLLRLRLMLNIRLKVCSTRSSISRWRSKDPLSQLSFQIGMIFPLIGRKIDIRLRILTFLIFTLSCER